MLRCRLQQPQSCFNCSYWLCYAGVQCRLQDAEASAIATAAITATVAAAALTTTALTASVAATTLTAVVSATAFAAAALAAAGLAAALATSTIAAALAAALATTRAATYHVRGNLRRRDSRELHGNITRFFS